MPPNSILARLISIAYALTPELRDLNVSRWPIFRPPSRRSSSATCARRCGCSTTVIGPNCRTLTWHCGSSCFTASATGRNGRGRGWRISDASGRRAVAVGPTPGQAEGTDAVLSKGARSHSALSGRGGVISNMAASISCHQFDLSHHMLYELSVTKPHKHEEHEKWQLFKKASFFRCFSISP